MSGKLIIGVMPIGNDFDISTRLPETISNIKFVVSETKKNFISFCKRNRINFKGEIVELNTNDEKSFSDCLYLIEKFLSVGEDVLIVSNAGYPNVFDNSGWMINEIASRGFDVTVIPGPSIVINAFAISALSNNQDEFLFAGNIPPNKDKRISYLQKYKDYEFPIIFVTIPFIENSIDDILNIFGDREIAICIDISKNSEKVIRGRLSNIKGILVNHRIFPYSPSLIEGAKQNIHSMYSEYTLVVSGKE